MMRRRVLGFCAAVLTASPAFAVSKAVKDACGSDYTAYCSQHDVDSSAVRSCMRSVRKKLTDGCVNALAESGEATKDDITQYKREMGR